MSIGEFSQRSGLSAKRLRTYAAEGLLAPAAVDPGSGYRYYAPCQIADARVIDALRQAGLPLAEIRSFMGQPRREQLDAWVRQVHTDANHRQNALAVARDLFAASEDRMIRTASPHPKENIVSKLQTVGRTDIGQLRENNEDAIVSSDRLALVADGMGGHPGGEIAANAAAGVVPAVFTGRSADELEAAVRAANWAIRDRAVAQPGLEGMGTTICAAGLLTDGHIALVNVGDSRAYLWRDGVLTQLTQDHSVTAELVTRAAARTRCIPAPALWSPDESTRRWDRCRDRPRNFETRVSRSTRALLRRIVQRAVSRRHRRSPSWRRRADDNR